MVVARHPASARSARRMLRYFLVIQEAPHYLDAAESVVGELVANAVRHARVPQGREICVRFEIEPGQLRIEVSDADADGLPRRRDADGEAESGRGLALLDALAEAWGCEPRACGVGKTVWATLAPGRHG
ncbi:ATP-binding protein [Peterkaempfera sp. SMS 1(5)a]|uniref:ATP-binding protein n=1 Tax=Peterkaempfera podocarpi TaxID=3232308 RepID=UPI00366EB5AA